MIDTHCHILPGLDDGPPTMEASLAMARIACEEGIRAVIATPHADLEQGAPPPDLIRQRVAELNAALQGAGLPLLVFPGAEVALSTDLPAALAEGRLMTLGDTGRYLLIELPFNGVPNYLGDVLFRVQLSGVTPVLAHPERSGLCRLNPREVDACVDRGAQVQLNVDSMTGREGKKIAQFARRLAREGKAWSIATDAHDTTARPPRFSPLRSSGKAPRLLARLLGGTPAVDRIGGEDVLRRLTEDNPAKALPRPRP